MCVKGGPKYYKFVLNTLCMAKFVTSSVILLAVAAKVKYAYTIKFILKIRKQEKGWRLDNFLMNVHLKECMDWNS